MARGLAVRGLTMQLWRARVLAAGPHTVRVAVTERETGARATDGVDQVALPTSAAHTRVIELRHNGKGSWRVASVRPGY